MNAMELRSRWKQAAGATLAVAALASTVACNGTPNVSTLAAQQPANQAGAPVVVSCEPHQRTLVRATVVNGAAVSQVECVAATPVAGEAQPQQVAYAPAPVYAPARRVSQPVYTDLGDAQVVPVSNRTGSVRRTNQVVYDERPVKRTRSVKKSAIIIGSSAGAGAGVGAAIGGKKGALIGAAIGGGGAAIWDQVTRRK
jgi:hypothetical protein